MIRNIKNIGGGCYIADYRFDEGIRINDDGICPCLCASRDMRTISNSLFLIEVIYENQE